MLHGLAPALLTLAACFAFGVADVARPDFRPSFVSHLPACADDCTPGDEVLGYIYSALYEPRLGEVHIFADLRHATGWPRNGSMMVDSCVFTNANKSASLYVPAVTTQMHDNPVFYSGFRVVCSLGHSVPASKARHSLWAGLSLQGRPYASRVPVTLVPREKVAPVGACLGTLYGGLERQPLIKEWATHMHSIGVHHFHAYTSIGNVRFEPDTMLAWWRPKPSEPPQDIPGMEWVNALTFEADFRWARGQLTHYQHCMFKHRHSYRYILFLDADEFPILRTNSGGMPALLEQAFQLYPKAAGISFHRFAFRAGCNASRQVAASEPWHAQFDAREKHSETERDFVERNWNHLQWGGQQMGDKLVAAPLRVDDLYFHFLISAREPYSPKPYTLSTLLAYVKHIRRYGDSDSCEDLTFDDPPATVAVSVALGEELLVSDRCRPRKAGCDLQRRACNGQHYRQRFSCQPFNCSCTTFETRERPDSSWRCSCFMLGGTLPYC